MTTHIVSGAGGRARIVEALRAGEIAALPTETVYGLAGAALNSMAVARIFEAKGRPHFDPLILHVPDTDWLWRVTNTERALSAVVERLVARFWPGPLTLVLPSAPVVPSLVRAGLPTVAVRQSAHPDFHNMLLEFSEPLAAPSANRFGRLSPTTAEDVVKELNGKIPLVYDGGRTAHGLESTIVRVNPDGVEILRPGPVTRETLEEVVPVLTAKPAAAGAHPEAPGQLASHYAPGTPLVLLPPDAGAAEVERVRGGRSAGCLFFDVADVWDGALKIFDEVRWLTSSRDLLEAAANLFANLRALDESGVDILFAFPPPSEGIGLAILDRLRRAAAPQ